MAYLKHSHQLAVGRIPRPDASVGSAREYERIALVIGKGIDCARVSGLNDKPHLSVRKRRKTKDGKPRKEESADHVSSSAPAF